MNRSLIDGAWLRGPGMQTSTDSPLARAAIYLLPLCTLLFLFSGFYKGTINSPLDLTVVAAAGVCACLCLCPGQFLKYPFIRTVIILYAFLSIYLGLRTLPNPSSFGIRKLGDAVLFGFPAILAGFAIGRNIGMTINLMRLLNWVAFPAAALVIFHAIRHDPYMPSEIGSGGYQLSGLFLTLCALASFLLRNPVSFGVSSLGAMVTGHISSNILLFIALLLIIVAMANWKLNIRNIGACSASLLLGVSLYTLLIAPPLLGSRVIWKVGSALVQETSNAKAPLSRIDPGKALDQQDPGKALDQQDPGKALAQQDPGKALSREDAGRALQESSGASGALVARIIEAMPSDAPKLDSAIHPDSADRFDIYRAAIQMFKEQPIFGVGYGKANYAGVLTAHNAVLELASEGGAIAALLGTLIFSISFYPLLCSVRRARAADADPTYQCAVLFALGYVIIVFGMYMFSGTWGSRLLCFAFGLSVAQMAGETRWRTVENTA